MDEITDGRGFEPLLFHIQGIFAVSALFQRAAAAGFQKNRRKIFHKIMGAGLSVFTKPMTSALFAFKKALKIGGMIHHILWVQAQTDKRCIWG